MYSKLSNLGGAFKIIRYLTGRYYCWIKFLKNVTFEQVYWLLEEYESEIEYNQLISLAIRYGFDLDVKIEVDTKTRICHFKRYLCKDFKQSKKTFESLMCYGRFFKFGSYPQISKDAQFSITNLTKKDCIGYEAASGALGTYSSEMVKNALVVPYACTIEEQTSIQHSIPNRFIICKPNGRRVAHPHLKYLTEFLDNNLMELDVTDKNIKIVGPKFDKKEVECFPTAKSVHFCTKKPVLDDVSRQVSSVTAIKAKKRRLEAQIEMYDKQIEDLNRELLKKPGSTYVQDVSKQIFDLTNKRTDCQIQYDDAKDEMNVLESAEDVHHKRICNTGAENCSEKCDVIFAMHSLYDVDLKKLLDNAIQSGANEVFATVILPFGLLFVDKYVSPELGTTFVKTGKGFSMIHAGDMSNGYVHDKAEQIMKLMRNSFVLGKEGNWSYEIVDSIAEICKLRFTRVNRSMRIVRKLVPAKFDRYCIIMNPMDYFSSMRKRTPMLIEVDKFESAIKMVKRSKSSKDIIENLYAHVQASYMKVVVGNTELQTGGTIDSVTEDAIVLAALIEGNVRKNILGNCYKRSLTSGNWLSKAVSAVWQLIKEGWCSIIPDGVLNFFTETEAVRYLKERVLLQDLFIDNKLNTMKGIIDSFDLVDSKYEGYFTTDVFIKYPTLSEIYKRDGDLRSAFKYSGDENLLKDYEELVAEQELDEEYSEIVKDLKALDCVESGLMDETNLKKISVRLESVLSKYNLAKQLAGLSKEAREEKKKLLEQSWDEDMDSIFGNIFSGKQIEEDNIDNGFKEIGNAEEINEEVKRGKFSSHDPHSTEHIDHKMDDLSKSALAFNQMRAKKIKSKKGKISEKNLETLMNAYTKPGKIANPVVGMDIVKQEIDKLINGYAVDASTVGHESLLRLKRNILKLAKEVLSSNKFDNLSKKNVSVVNGYAGCGKTRKILEKFDVVQDSYISPLSQILFDFSGKLKSKYPEEMKMSRREDMLKTYEKLDEIKKNGKTLYIDESSKFSFGFILLILLVTNYEEYVFVGDCEQSRFFDPTGTASHLTYVDLVRPEDVTVYYYTFRFGPTVAAFNNTAFNYPVFSLKETDTTLVYHTIEEFNSERTGTNITITSTTQNYIVEDLKATNCLTSVASQGLSVPVANVILKGVDMHAAVSFRANGIVAATRAEETLNLFIDYTSKRSNDTKNFEILRENYAQVFDIVLPSISDFQ